MFAFWPNCHTSRNLPLREEPSLGRTERISAAGQSLRNDGKYRAFRFRPTPHLPPRLDAGVSFEETQRTLFTRHLFHQNGI